MPDPNLVFHHKLWSISLPNPHLRLSPDLRPDFLLNVVQAGHFPNPKLNRVPNSEPFLIPHSNSDPDLAEKNKLNPWSILGANPNFDEVFA